MTQKALNTSRALQLVLTAVIFIGSLSFGSPLNYSQREMAQIIRIAREIHIVQPYLDDSKYMEYAVGIYHAWRRYDVEPEILIAITQRETGFREDLPEGAAGELGICQIRKMWIKQPKFRREFRHAKIRDLFRPAKSFLYAAWILHQLKRDVRTDTIPYWSYYNSVRFENRFKYFVAVNKNLVALKRGQLDWVARPDYMETQVSAPSRWLADSRPAAPQPEDYQRPALRVAMVTPAKSRWLTPQYRVRKHTRRSVRLASNGGGWIPAALRKLQERSNVQPYGAANRSHHVSAAILRAAAELDVKGLFSSNTDSLAD